MCSEIFHMVDASVTLSHSLCMHPSKRVYYRVLWCWAVWWQSDRSDKLYDSLNATFMLVSLWISTHCLKKILWTLNIKLSLCFVYDLVILSENLMIISENLTCEKSDYNVAEQSDTSLQEASQVLHSACLCSRQKKFQAGGSSKEQSESAHIMKLDT